MYLKEFLDKNNLKLKLFRYLNRYFQCAVFDRNEHISILNYIEDSEYYVEENSIIKCINKINLNIEFENEIKLEVSDEFVFQKYLDIL